MVAGALIQGFSVHGKSFTICVPVDVCPKLTWACPVTVGMYIVARMILGFGIPTCIVSGSSLIGELAYPKERPVMTSLFNVSYFVGQIVAAAIAFGTNDIKTDWAWRIPSFLQICPSLLQLSFVL